MKTARIFLSHASPDKPLVHEVATALAHRGVLAWVDVHELRAGDDLSRALTRAVETQSLLACSCPRMPWKARGSTTS